MHDGGHPPTQQQVSMQVLQPLSSIAAKNNWQKISNKWSLQPLCSEAAKNIWKKYPTNIPQQVSMQVLLFISASCNRCAVRLQKIFENKYSARGIDAFIAVVCNRWAARLQKVLKKISNKYLATGIDASLTFYCWSLQPLCSGAHVLHPNTANRRVFYTLLLCTLVGAGIG